VDLFPANSICIVMCSNCCIPAALVKAMRHDGQGKLFTARAAIEGQLATALQQAFSADVADHLAFIEVCLESHRRMQAGKLDQPPLVVCHAVTARTAVVARA
jgi:hypothetical protein